MRTVAACTEISTARKILAPDAVLVSTMSAMFAFDQIGDSERRIDSVPLMGGAGCLGLGISLSRPDLPVWVVDGDASLLMELGGLVTIANARPLRFLHIVVNNGSQFSGVFNLQRPGTGASGCDFSALALAAGYTAAHTFSDVDSLREAMPALSRTTGPVLVDLLVEADPRQFGPGRPQPPIPDRQFERMRDAVPVLRAVLSGAAQ